METWATRHGSSARQGRVREKERQRQGKRARRRANSAAGEAQHATKPSETRRKGGNGWWQWPRLLPCLHNVHYTLTQTKESWALRFFAVAPPPVAFVTADISMLSSPHLAAYSPRRPHTLHTPTPRHTLSSHTQIDAYTLSTHHLTSTHFTNTPTHVHN